MAKTTEKTIKAEPAEIAREEAAVVAKEEKAEVAETVAEADATAKAEKVEAVEATETDVETDAETDAEAEVAEVAEADAETEKAKETSAEVEEKTDAEPVEETDAKTDAEANAEIDAEAGTESGGGTDAAEKGVFAKAGKRSKKTVEAEEAEAARQARKLERQAEEEEAVRKPKGEAPKVRPRLERRGKNYREKAKLIEKGKVYSLKEGVELAIQTSPARFDATLEAHVRLGVDPRQADQNVRATLVLPHGSGKSVKVAVFAPLDEAKQALEAGADLAEDEEFLKRLDKGELDFDVLITVPAYMPKLGKYARALGPKGLMPNPKSGTVTADVEKAVREAKAGKVEYRVDKQALVHIGLGKVSFGAEQLTANAEAFFKSLAGQKPASLKGVYVRSAYLSTTMGPSVRIESLGN